MNPEDLIAHQAMMARLTGAPMPQATQVSPQAGVQVPQPQVVPQDQLPTQGDQQLGDMTKKRPPNESDSLAKSALAGTAHTDPNVQDLSKALLAKLLPYLGSSAAQPIQQPGAPTA